MSEVRGVIINDAAPNRSSHAADAVPVDIARATLRAALDRQVQDAISFHVSRATDETNADHLPAHSAIRITTGAGKSDTMRIAAARYVREAKARGIPHRVVMLVPTHRLGAEARGRVANDISAALLQSRKADDVETGEPLCLNLSAVEVAEAIGADVERSACRKPRKGDEPILCAFYHECRYQKQKQIAKRADIVFAAHQYAYSPPPELIKKVGLVVIDESFWQSGLSTSGRIAVDGLGAELKSFPVRDPNGATDYFATAHLADLIERLQQAVRVSPEGAYLGKSALLAAGLLPGDGYEDGSAASAGKLEWRRKVNFNLAPNSSEETLASLLKQYRFQGQLPRRAAIWRAVHDLLTGAEEATGRLRTERKLSKDGSVLYLRVNARRDIHPRVADLPIIVLDATLNIDIVRYFLPRIDLKVDINVDAPHERIVQVVDLPVGKASLSRLDGGKRKPEEELRVGRKRNRLASVVRRLARGRCGVVITNKELEQQIELDGTNVDTAHFNAIEGIDRWRDAEILVTIGRPLPSPKATEDMAAALTGKPVTLALGPSTRPGGRPQQMIVVERPIRLKDGSELMLPCRVFDAAEAELIRKAVTEAAVVQALGRARGVNRTADNPVEVYMILHDTTVPTSVDAVIQFCDLEPTNIDIMVERGLLPQWGADAAKLYPDLWPSAQAAKKAYQRAKLDVERLGRARRGGHSLIDIIYKDLSLSSFLLVRYQPQARRAQARLALVDQTRVLEARERIDAEFGPLALFEFIPSRTQPLVQAGDPMLALIWGRPGGNFAARYLPDRRIVTPPARSFLCEPLPLCA
ncbi:hypothetical protein JQ616_38985 [Bradyrhizobium tropiciagri]|uniref:hypothetical protein n=1 Tax=Bradyrhizobium tropiciagri TaxID=312253 RepID=UPI001BA65660|nr:hypothetical protein [Bradyrhizobium tropiciagri]MBR0900978.1 hypothetical protein [Bradyrhizobium tropiciagri]